MVLGEGTVGLVSPSGQSFGDEHSNAAEVNKARLLHRSVTGTAAGASSQILKAVYVRYRDHVFFRNVETPTAEAIIREALGWVKEENDEVMLIECDRPLPECRSGFNGVVVIKSCIVSMVSLDFEYVLNCPHPLLKNRVCASSQRSEKLSSKIQKGAKKH